MEDTHLPPQLPYANATKPRCCFGVHPTPQQLDLDEYIQEALKEGWDLTRLPTDVDVYTARLALRELIPFRPLTCSYCPMMCCGMCGRPCKVRCVQDLLHKTKFMNSLQLDDDKLDTFKKLSTNPTITYTQLQQLFCNTYPSMHNKRRNNPFTLDYAPKYKGITRTSKGVQKRSFDPITGQAAIYEWPETGLCPYCLPEVSATVTSNANQRRYRKPK